VAGHGERRLRPADSVPDQAAVRELATSKAAIVTGSSARVLVIGGGRFAHHFAEGLIARDASVRIARLQRSEPSQQPSAGIRVEVNSEFPTEWLAMQVIDGGYDVVVIANSAVSPYPSGVSTGWTRVRAELPFGLSTPLQTKYLFPVAEAVRDLGNRRPVLLNACYPDVTNQLAAMHAQAPDWGLGNGHVLASFLSAQSHQEILVVAHHWHLHAPPDETTELSAWSADGVAQSDIGRRLHAFRTMSQLDRNRHSADEAACQVSHALLGKVMLSSVTAPAGFAGTVPCLLRGFAVDYRLDQYCEVTWAKSQLAHWAHREGVVVDTRARTVEFVGPVQEFYRSRFGASLYPISEWPQLTAQLERWVAEDKIGRHRRER
jgi:hypothetical protein